MTTNMNFKNLYTLQKVAARQQLVSARRYTYETITPAPLEEEMEAPKRRRLMGASSGAKSSASQPPVAQVLDVPVPASCTPEQIDGSFLWFGRQSRRANHTPTRAGLASLAKVFDDFEIIVRNACYCVSAEC